MNNHHGEKSKTPLQHYSSRWKCNKRRSAPFASQSRVLKPSPPPQGRTSLNGAIGGDWSARLAPPPPHWPRRRSCCAREREQERDRERERERQLFHSLSLVSSPFVFRMARAHGLLLLNIPWRHPGNCYRGHKCVGLLSPSWREDCVCGPLFIYLCFYAFGIASIFYIRYEKFHFSFYVLFFGCFSKMIE